MDDHCEHCQREMSVDYDPGKWKAYDCPRCGHWYCFACRNMGERGKWGCVFCDG